MEHDVPVLRNDLVGTYPSTVPSSKDVLELVARTYLDWLRPGAPRPTGNRRCGVVVRV
jgi:hypothetical protein